jgi:hypothetical protein
MVGTVFIIQSLINYNELFCIISVFRILIQTPLIRMERKEGEAPVGAWLEDVARCIVECFKLGENNDDVTSKEWFLYN